MKKIILISFCLCVNHVLCFAQNDSSLPKGFTKNRQYPARPPYSLQFGIGMANFLNDAVKLDPVYNDLKSETGITALFDLVIPIPHTKFLAIHLSTKSISSSDVKSQKEKDLFVFGSKEYQDWQQFDPTNQHGVLSYLENNFYTQYTWWDSYSLDGGINIGPSLYIPLGKRWSNFFYVSYQGGYSKLKSAEIKKTLEQSFLISINEPDYSLVTEAVSNKVFVNTIETGFYLTAGKHLGMTFSSSYVTTSKASFNYSTQLLSSSGQILTTKNASRDISFQSLNLFIKLGLRF